MREFIVASQRSASLPKSVEKYLNRRAPAGSLFRADHATCLSLHEGHTIAAFRYLLHPGGEVPNRFFDGIAVARRRLVQDEASLGAVDPKDFAETARGVFSLVSIEPQRLRIFCDPLSVYPLWYWQSDDLFVCSNNTHLIRWLLAELGIRVAKDAQFFAWQLIFQNGVADSTGYKGVRWTPFGHYVTISAEGDTVEVTMDQLKVASDERLYRSERSHDELIEEAYSEITENVLTIASGDFQARVCDLSGGLDTRVMVAAILHHGLEQEFGFNTAGTQSTPDGNVAALIRERYGLRRSRYVQRPDRPDPAPSTALRSMLFRTYGCFSQQAAIGLGVRSDRSMLHFNGAGGETFRSFYPAQEGGRSTVHDRLLSQMRVHGAMVRPEVRERLAEILDGLFVAKAKAGFRDADAGDQHYIEHRNRQFVGTQCRTRLNFQSAIYPLYSPAAITAAFSVSHSHRDAAGIHFELIDRLFPELLEIPLESRTWDPKLYKGHAQQGVLASLDPARANGPSLTSPKHVDDVLLIERATYPVRTSSRIPEPTIWEQRMMSEGRHWSWVQLESALRCLREEVGKPELLETMSTVFDPDAVLKFAERDLSSFTKSIEIRQVHRLQSASLWLTNQELAIPLEV